MTANRITDFATWARAIEKRVLRLERRPAGTGGTGGTGPPSVPLVVKDEGVPLPQRGSLNFVGTGVTVTDNAVGDSSVVTVSGGGTTYFPPTRQSSEFTTASTAVGANATGTIRLASAYRLYFANCWPSTPCRVRLYTSVGRRNADISRPIGTDPTGDHGCMFEFVFTSSLFASVLSPMVDGFTGIDGNVPYTVTNTGTATVAMVFGFDWIKTE